ncbi:MAG: hypothetical protein ACYC3I_27705, partial [Gemmataceae bacterium]
MALWKCLASLHFCEGVSEMRLNMQLPYALMQRKVLLGMELGVYWMIVLAITFHTDPDNNLSDMQMMKR